MFANVSFTNDFYSSLALISIFAARPTNKLLPDLQMCS